jgi:hypothetical protein
MTTRKRTTAATTKATSSVVTPSRTATALPVPSLTVYVLSITFLLGFWLAAQAPQYAPWPLSLIRPDMAMLVLQLVGLIHLTEAYVAVVICRKRGRSAIDTCNWAFHVCLGGVHYLLRLTKTRNRRDVFYRLPIATYIIFIMISSLVAYAYLTPITQHPAPLRVLTNPMGEKPVGYAFKLLFGIHTTEALLTGLICLQRGYRVSNTLLWMLQSAITGMNGMHLLFHSESSS